MIEAAEFFYGFNPDLSRSLKLCEIVIEDTHKDISISAHFLRARALLLKGMANGDLQTLLDCLASFDMVTEKISAKTVSKTIPAEVNAEIMSNYLGKPSSSVLTV